MQSSIGGGAIINRFPKDDVLIEILFNLIKRIIDTVKKTSIITDYILELKDCLVWCINIFNELLTSSETKEDDIRKQECTVK